MNPQRQARWSIGNTGGSIISDKSDGITISGGVGEEADKFYGGTLVGESMNDNVAKMIIADHEFCQSLTESDRDCFCDLVWWLKGYKAGAKDNMEECPFDEDHLKALDKLIRNMRSVLK